MARQGCVFSETDIRKIIALLSTTDMTLPEIAERLGCTRGAVAALNRRYQVRKYAGLRSTWVVETKLVS